MPVPRIIQIEVSTACQLRCVFCPRTALKDKWVSKHMDMDVFSVVLRHIKKGQLVHLQGWGEPLLNPRIMDMAAAVKKNHGSISLTTNGMRMDETVSRELCRIGFGIVAISLAGAKGSTNDALRKGAQFTRIVDNISSLTEMKNRPSVHLIMQMMRPNMEELPDMISLAAQLKVDKLIVSNIDYIPTPDVHRLKAFDIYPDERTDQIVEATKRKAQGSGVKLIIYPLSPLENNAICDSDPLHNVVITVSGEVAPCVYLSLPYKGNIPRLFREESEEFQRFTFGNVSDGIYQLLNKEPAGSFLDAFKRRVHAGRLGAVTDVTLLSMPRIRSTSGAFLEPASQLLHPLKYGNLPPAPFLCQSCYKLYGI